MREVSDELAQMLQGFDPELWERMVLAAEGPKCWYFWPPPTVDASHYELQEEDFGKVRQGSIWRATSSSSSLLPPSSFNS